MRAAPSVARLCYDLRCATAHTTGRHPALGNSFLGGIASFLVDVFLGPERTEDSFRGEQNP